MPPDRRIYLFREMAQTVSREQIGEYAVRITPALAMAPAELEGLAAYIAAQQTK